MEAPAPGYSVLTHSQIAHFLTHGWVCIPECFDAAFAASHTRDLFTRLGIDPADKTTWSTVAGKTNMPSHDRHVPIPAKAWGAMCDLLGGAERIDLTIYGGPGGQRVDAMTWNDGFIVNLGSDEWEGREDIDPRDLGNWHVDGDFFTHFLDSPEQGLLVIPCWTDVVPGGGGTFVCPDAIKDIAEHLYANPAGVLPRMCPVSLPATSPSAALYKDLNFYDRIIHSKSPSPSQPSPSPSPSPYIELTAPLGSVILCHPLLPHSASRNPLRRIRVITNPPISLREPFRFDREDPREYSLVEEKTLNVLGRERGEDLKGKDGEIWRVIGERRELVPERVRRQEEMRVRERERLAREGAVRKRERERGQKMEKGDGEGSASVEKGNHTTVEERLVGALEA